MPTAELRKKLKVPQAFLAKILQKLIQKGIVSSQKGKMGGVKIKNPRVSLLEVIKLFEPRFVINKCLLKGYVCSFKGACPLHAVLRAMQSDMCAKLAKVSFEELKK